MTTTTKPQNAWAAALLTLMIGLVFGLGSPPGSVFAHGGGTPQLADVQVGPYALWVWVDPEPPRVGEMHVSVAVNNPETEGPILNAAVTVQIESLDSEAAPLTASATLTNSDNKLLYTAVLEPPVEGQWRVTVSVAGSAGSGNETFDVSVLPAQSINWGLFGIIGISLLTTGWIAWMFLSRRETVGQ